jgi:hypothetical protein
MFFFLLDFGTVPTVWYRPILFLILLEIVLLRKELPLV